MNPLKRFRRLLPVLSILALGALLHPAATAHLAASQAGGDISPGGAGDAQVGGDGSPVRSDAPMSGGGGPQAGSDAQGRSSEIRLDAALVKEFLEVIFFGDDGRLHFREYSVCSYQFLQNPVVSIEGGLVLVSADYFARRGSEGLGGCVGSPGMDTPVAASARVSATGSALLIEVLSVETSTLPALSSVILDLVGVKLPLRHEFDLMAAINGVLYGNQSFGVSSLEVHEVLTEQQSVLVRLTMRLGIW